MLVAEFSTKELPAGERFAYWRETGVSYDLPTEIRTEHERDFEGRMRVLRLGGLQVSTLTCPPLEAVRTQRHIRRSDPEIVSVTLSLRGRMGLAQEGREVLIGPGDMMLCDNSLPFQGWTTGPRTTECVIAQFHRGMLPVPPDALAGLTATRLPGHEGLGALIGGYLTSLDRNADSCTDADASRLAYITLDLLATLCAHHLDTTDLLPPGTRRAALEAAVRAFIDRRLGDPALSPAVIADAHHISTRHLHHLFEGRGPSVAAYIRHQRLERCRRDLADPRLGSHPIHAIATRWGFTGNAPFSRAFRTAYGMSPRDYRHMALRTPAPRERPAAGRERSATA